MPVSESESARSASAKKKPPLGGGRFLAIILGLGVGLLLAKAVFGVIVALIAHYGFGANWNTAAFVGVMAYLVPSIIFATLELFSNEGGKRKR